MVTLDTAPAPVSSGEARSVTPAPRVNPARALTYDFLAWAASSPRTYADVLACWPTSCPRLSIWEDALDDGLVQLTRDDQAGGPAIVTLTAAGRLMLDSRR